MMIREIVKDVYWVGYVDWNIRDFHSYVTERGATYNSYLVRGEKTALIDAVKAQYADQLLENIKKVAGLETVDYVVCNHAEPDHSGGLPLVMKELPNAVLLCNKKCKDVLDRYYDTDGWKYEIVEDGGTVSLGGRTLQFINTPLVHWPESMFTWLPEESILFSMDAFGQHLATSERFDDEIPESLIFEEAKTYYANIIMPFGPQVQSVLKKASELNIKIIAPSHGLIWRSHMDKIFKSYDDWSAGRFAPKVLVIYDTMWESTEKMANAILEGATQPGVSVQLIHVRRTSLTRIATEVLDAAAVAFGSSTLNKGMMPMAGAALTYMNGMMPAGKAGFAFGSSGWGKGGPDAVHEYLDGMKWDLIRDPLKSKFRPTDEILEECRAAGRTLAEKARELSL